MTKTIFEAYNDCKKELESAGIEDYVFESKQIIKHVTGYSNAQILSKYNERLTEFQQNNMTAIIKQRLVHYPLQYIMCEWGFYGREFSVGPGVLVPRQDSETVIDVALERLGEKQEADVLDLCAGTGCLGITVAAERPYTTVTLVEKYPEAATYIYKNIRKNDVPNTRVIEGDIFECPAADEKFDIIISNPPYVSASEMEKLPPEVRFEPDTALYGGEDGLLFYRAITSGYRASLKSGGFLIFEIGEEQGEAVSEILKANGFKDVGIRKDAAGNDRVVFGTAVDVQ